MVHELAVVAIDNAHAVHLQMRIAVTRDVVLHMRRLHRDIIRMEEDVEFRIQHPHLTPRRDELVGKDAEALNFTLRDKSADEHHVRCLRVAPVWGWWLIMEGNSYARLPFAPCTTARVARLRTRRRGDCSRCKALMRRWR